MKPLIYTSAVSILLSVFINGGIPRANAQDEKSGTDPMTESLQPLKGKEFEVMFLKHMIHHHQSAIDMAELASTNTKRAELIKMGGDIISAQKAEIDQMTGWLKKHGERAGSMEQMPGMEKMMKEMEALKKSKDAEFDKMFLEMMIEHHAGAVRMSRLLKEKGIRPELLKFADKVIKDQTAEIAQMKGWQAAWFKK